MSTTTFLDPSPKELPYGCLEPPSTKCVDGPTRSRKLTANDQELKIILNFINWLTFRMLRDMLLQFGLILHYNRITPGGSFILLRDDYAHRSCLRASLLDRLRPSVCGRLTQVPPTFLLDDLGALISRASRLGLSLRTTEHDPERHPHLAAWYGVLMNNCITREFRT